MAISDLLAGLFIYDPVVLFNLGTVDYVIVPLE
jgi:hypothetical protein